MSDKDLLTRIRGKLLGMGRVGTAWKPAMEEDWDEILIQSEGTFQFIGAAVVGVWEVSLADLGRSTRARLEPDVSRTLVDRVSDALVPTLDPIQAGGRELPKALKSGREQARRTGVLLDAVAPSVMLLKSLGLRVSTGWGKSVEYLRPVFEAYPNGDATLEAMKGGSNDLAAVFDGPAQTLHKALGALPESMHLGVGVTSPLEDYRYAVSAGLEEALYAQRTHMITLLDALPKRD